MNEYVGKRVTVAGLGHFGGGISAARWLASRGARVLVTDTLAPEKLAESVRQLDGLGIEFRLGEHRDEDFTGSDLVVASTAIPPHNPYLTAARNAGVPITTEIRLFVERCPATVWGVTGTKGKSTTTAMLGRMLATRFKTFVGGNIGKSLLEDLERIGRDDIVVLELSSFMLHYLGQIAWSPHVAVVTLIADDHGPWHGSHQEYIEAKKNILRNQKPDDFAVLNEESPLAMDFAKSTRARVIAYGLGNRKRFDLKIPGEHNQLNVQAAFTAAQTAGIDFSDAQRALCDFLGLPHRLQLVHESGGVRYFNDSIATIPDAAIAALGAFPSRKVIQIVGGFDKQLPLVAMCTALGKRAKAVLCIGQIGPDIARIMGQSQSGGADVSNCGNLATAIVKARSIAVPGDVVLLSPGTSSYGQFASFEERGEAFACLARQEEGKDAGTK